MYLVLLACFIVKNSLLLFCAAVIPAEPGEWELGCALRTPSIALFPKCRSAAARLPTYRMLEELHECQEGLTWDDLKGHGKA